MYVSPRTDCPHIKADEILSLDLFKKISFHRLQCQCCKELNELWVCIKC